MSAENWRWVGYFNLLDNLHNNVCRNGNSMHSLNITLAKEKLVNTDIYHNGDRRKKSDRRQFTYTFHIPERRCGFDRRTGEDRRRSDRDSEKS